MAKNNDVINFNSKKEFINYLKTEKDLIKSLGSGAEGECFLSATDNYVYKIIHSSLKRDIGYFYNLDEILTTRDIDVDSFIFPEQLYAIRNRLVGLKHKYINVNLFDGDIILNNPNSIYQIDFKSLLKSYYVFLKDVEKISEQRILIYDLPGNLIYNGTKLVGIDTLRYRKVDYDPIEENKIETYTAITSIIDEWLYELGFFEKEEINSLYYETEIEEYLKGVQKILKK